MGEAFVWGVVGGSSLIIGGVVALRVAISSATARADHGLRRRSPDKRRRVRTRPRGVRDLGRGWRNSHWPLRGLGRLLRRAGTDRPPGGRRARGRRRADTRAATAGRAIVLGIILDGIPESLVLGLTVLEAGTVSVAFLVAVFLANLPEAIAATTALSRAGRTSSRIMRFWVLVCLGFGLASLAGYVLLDSCLAANRSPSCSRSRAVQSSRCSPTR